MPQLGQMWPPLDARAACPSSFAPTCAPTRAPNQNQISHIYLDGASWISHHHQESDFYPSSSMVCAPYSNEGSYSCTCDCFLNSQSPSLGPLPLEIFYYELLPLCYMGHLLQLLFLANDALTPAQKASVTGAGWGLPVAPTKARSPVAIFASVQPFLELRRYRSHDFCTFVPGSLFRSMLYFFLCWLFRGW